jgi:tetratricopeptide (TPR) repeat protein
MFAGGGRVPKSAALGILLLTGGVGCGQYGEHPRCPSAGGSPWFEIAADHFTVVSDLPREEAEATARGLEEALDALSKVSFEHPRIPVERTTVVIFRSGSDFHAFHADLVGGTFQKHLANDPEGPRFLVVYDSLSPETRIPFIHELTHDLIDRNFGAAPPWLSEGWAEYYSTLSVEDGKIIIGESPRTVTFTDERAYSYFTDKSGKVFMAVPIDQVRAPSELMKMSAPDFYSFLGSQKHDNQEELRVETLYVSAWAFVHMLVDGPSAYQHRLEIFEQGAASGKRLPEALHDAFGDLPAAELDRDFRRYLGAGELAVWRTPYEPPSKPFALSVRKLTDSEVHLYWARLTSWKGTSADTARRDLDAALAAEPSSPEPRYYRGLFEMARNDLSAAKRELAAALAASPEEPRYLLGMLTLKLQEEGALTNPEKVRVIASLAAHLGRRARTATELNSAADTLNQVGRSDVSLVLAERALALAPFEAAILDTYAAALFALGRVAEAVDEQTAAVSFMNERQTDPGILQRLELYKSKAQ